MKIKLLVAALSIGMGFLSNSLLAQSNNVNNLVEKIVASYGGDTLTKAKSIQITDHNKGPWPGESEHPGVPEIWRINEVLTIDFVNKRKSLLSWRVNRTSVDLDKFVFDGKQGRHYDILHNKYSNEDWIRYGSLGGSIIRTSDTMLAYMLNNAADTAEDKGITAYRGKPHHKLSFTAKTGHKFLLYADAETGLINKMVRHHPSIGDLVYVFSNHKQNDGVTYSDDMNFFVGGEIRLISTERDLVLNPNIENEFKPLPDFKHWGERIDTSEIQTKKIAQGVYQTGKGRALNIFIDNGDHFIASGSARALKENYAAMKSHAGVDKPIKYFVVTHHHRGTVAGLDSVVGAGIKLITAERHLAEIEKRLDKKLADDQVKLISERKNTKLGKVVIYDIASAHSEHNLVMYLPEHKALYAEGHYESDLATAYPRVFKDMVLFYEHIQKLGINVSRYLDANSFRQFSAGEFATFAKEFTKHTCPTGYDICQNG